ncbi:MAG TPA: hypothetical protein VIY68_06250 [Steroidobacteraceae bacterium]|jgi:hypothetical protein
MAEEKFDENLLRMIAAELHFSNAMAAAREMYGKGYFSLGVGERVAVDHAVFAAIGANYQAITPAYLASHTAQQPMGFRAHETTNSPGTS